jgi:hypothetical protein
MFRERECNRQAAVHLILCTRGAMELGCARVPSLRKHAPVFKRFSHAESPYTHGSLSVYGDCHYGMLRQVADNTRLASLRSSQMYTVTRCNAKALIENRSRVLVLITAVSLACLHTGAVRRRSAEPGGIRTHPSLGGRWLFAVPKRGVEFPTERPLRGRGGDHVRAPAAPLQRTRRTSVARGLLK